jgi:tryptophan synthase alpha chain
MNRIVERFNKLKAENKKALIPYICSGDPSVEASEKLVYALEEAGADVIELGVPFSDPLADGPVIQGAALRSLNAGFKIKNVFDIVRNVRKNSEIPLVVMVYFSTIMNYGCQKFIDDCVESGLDGLIVPDLPYEEYDDLKPIVDKTDLCMIPLIAITSEDRIPMLVEGSKGFIYCVSSLGVTGERKEFDNRVDNFVAKVKAATDTPACIGFGIATHEDVERFNKIADGCIVGSAIVRKIFESNMNIEEIKSFVSGLK